MTAPARAAWWIYFALMILLLVIPAYCSAEDGTTETKPIQNAPTIIDWDKQTITMSMELWRSIMLRIQSFDDYQKEDRGKIKREIEQELDKKHCI